MPAPRLGKGSSKRMQSYGQAAAGQGPTSPTSGPPQEAGFVSSDEQMAQQLRQGGYPSSQQAGGYPPNGGNYPQPQDFQSPADYGGGGGGGGGGPRQSVSWDDQYQPSQPDDGGTSGNPPSLTSRQVSLKAWQVIAIAVGSLIAGVVVCVLVYKLVTRRKALSANAAYYPYASPTQPMLVPQAPASRF